MKNGSPGIGSRFLVEFFGPDVKYFSTNHVSTCLFRKDYTSVTHYFQVQHSRSHGRCNEEESTVFFQ
jgi:hypothetical protein